MMKTIGTTLGLSFTETASRQRLRTLLQFLLFFFVMVIIYAIVFKWISWWEQPSQQHSWTTAFYWVFVVMSTLGFGDITFQSDLGRFFSVVVLLSGSIFVLVLLPFMFIQFFYIPWLESQEAARAPRAVPSSLRKHVVLTGYGPVELTLVRMLNRVSIPYTMIVSDHEEALRLHDAGYSVMVGEIDNPETYRNANVSQAELVIAFQKDTTNSNIAFTVREISEQVGVASLASFEASVDILELAGSNWVIRLGEILGQSLSARVAADARCHIIGDFGDLKIAEAEAMHTPLVGRKLKDIRLDQHAHINVIGVWNRGNFELAGPETMIHSSSMLMLAGTQQELEEYDGLFCMYGNRKESVIIIGGGRVGRAVARNLEERGINYRLIEKNPQRIRDQECYVLGDAAEIEVLEAAGIRDCTSVVITSHDDDVNVYLTIYCRRLRSDVRVLVRANLDRNVSTLHRAGADYVMSYASTGAYHLYNLIRPANVLLMTEGLDVFRVPIEGRLVGKTLAGIKFRQLTGCNVVAIESDGVMDPHPDPNLALPQGADLIVVGDHESEDRLYQQLS